MQRVILGLLKVHDLVSELLRIHLEVSQCIARSQVLRHSVFQFGQKVQHLVSENRVHNIMVEIKIKTYNMSITIYARHVF